MSSTSAQGCAPAAGNRYSEALDTGSGHALNAFKSWYQAGHDAGHIRMPSTGVLEVHGELSDQFMIGLLGNRYFIGVPQSALGWFLDAPWVHVALRPGFSGLALVCGRFASGKKGLKEFVLYFGNVSTAIAQYLSNYHYLDIRAIVMTDEEGQRAVSKKAAMTLEVVPVAGEINFDTFAKGASSSAFHLSLVSQPRVHAN
ncbi:hypothetical protein [Hydrogenophaga sp. 2FB]|uniref:hypothetical protein n=1 Tax=Hydrogenophaga sp. 2FB TaxID=2502187 RepID=UPI0010F87746|nr:hypothetical protein [Hydrogenophaga sp. 2FB]